MPIYEAEIRIDASAEMGIPETRVQSTCVWAPSIVDAAIELVERVRQLKLPVTRLAVHDPRVSRVAQDTIPRSD